MMRKEYIKYMENMPIQIEVLDIREYPIHWHNALEIIFVLRGSVYLNIEAGTYKVRERQLEIVNADEAHRIYSDEENRVLMLQIDPSFFNKYYPDMKNMFFYADTSQENIQDREEYRLLRKFVAVLLLETIKRAENYQEVINRTLIDLLYHLINHFHYLIYEKEELKDDEEQLQRYHRIVKYIYNNYQNKISLQEIAEKEFLSSHYLSHKIKNMIGVNFKEFLNLTRVEESIKLLLNTDKTLTEISEELGFSHIRYFNKYFKKYYGMMPKEYRKKYKKTEEELKRIKKVTAYPIDTALDDIEEYLKDYPRYNIEEKIIKINLNLCETGSFFKKTYEDYLYLGDFEYVFLKSTTENLKILRDMISFQYIILKNCFSGLSYTLFKEGIKRIRQLNFKPYIIIDEKEENTFLSWIDRMIEDYSLMELETWQFNYHKTLDERIIFVNEKMDLNHEQTLIEEQQYITYMMKKMMEENLIIQAINFEEEVFPGGWGLLHYQGIKKPSYYVLYLLSFLGKQIIDKGENYILTRDEDNYQILIFNKEQEKVNKESHFFINVENLLGDYQMTKFQIDQKKGSSYTNWKAMGSPTVLSSYEKKLLEFISFPSVEFKYVKKSNVYPINFKIFGSGIALIVLGKVQKTP